MAKRARGSSTRPGQRAPIQRTSTRPPSPTTAATPPTPSTDDDPLAETALGAYGGQSSLTDADLARAATLEAQIVAQEKAADAAKQPKTRAVVPRATSTLAASAADEYAYVSRDIRRITLIGGGLIAFLLGLWVFAQVTGVRI
jgi:hypothetical protein